MEYIAQTKLRSEFFVEITKKSKKLLYQMKVSRDVIGKSKEIWNWLVHHFFNGNFFYFRYFVLIDLFQALYLEIKSLKSTIGV
jgi:hypothetical protein